MVTLDSSDREIDNNFQVHDFFHCYSEQLASPMLCTVVT